MLFLENFTNFLNILGIVLICWLYQPHSESVSTEALEELSEQEKVHWTDLSYRLPS